MVAVDTSVLASVLLRGPFGEQARALYAADPDWRSDAFVMIERANVLTTRIKLRDMPLADAPPAAAAEAALAGRSPSVARSSMIHVLSRVDVHGNALTASAPGAAPLTRFGAGLRAGRLRTRRRNDRC